MRQPSFIGKPLTDRPRPAGRLERRVDTDRLALEQLAAAHQALLDKLVGLNSIAQACEQLLIQPRRRVIWSGTAIIGPTGVWSFNAKTVARSIFLVNYTANGTVTVAAGTPQVSSPGPGVGTHNVPAGVAATFNDETTDWTLYGTPGNAVDVQIFGVPMPPTAAGDI